MAGALMKRPPQGGIVSGVASALIPGLGQFLNGEKDKALGVFVVVCAAKATFLGALPLMGVVGWGAYFYGIADGYFGGKKKSAKTS